MLTISDYRWHGEVGIRVVCKASVYLPVLESIRISRLSSYSTLKAISSRGNNLDSINHFYLMRIMFKVQGSHCGETKCISHGFFAQKLTYYLAEEVLSTHRQITCSADKCNLTSTDYTGHGKGGFWQGWFPTVCQGLASVLHFSLSHTFPCEIVNTMLEQRGICGKRWC